jgi:hypothetical protein
MDKENRLTFSEVLSAQFKRLKAWLKPEPDDHLALKVIKMILKSVAMLVLLAFSPILLIGLALGFIGLM